MLFEHGEEMIEEEEERDVEVEEEEEEEREDRETFEDISLKASIMPELVVVLEASDNFLIERIIDLPEKEIQGTHYTEKHMIRRLREYR